VTTAPVLVFGATGAAVALSHGRYSSGRFSFRCRFATEPRTMHP
jgi:hypothetical protein